MTKEDLARHFGLDTTPYLRSSSWIELAVERTGTSQGFGFINVPERLASKSSVIVGTSWSSTVVPDALIETCTLLLQHFFPFALQENIPMSGLEINFVEYWPSGHLSQILTGQTISFTGHMQEQTQSQ